MSLRVACAALLLLSEVVAIRPRMHIPSGSVQFVLNKHLFPYMPEGWAIREDDEGGNRDVKDQSEPNTPATVRGATIPILRLHHDTLW